MARDFWPEEHARADLAGTPPHDGHLKLEEAALRASLKLVPDEGSDLFVRHAIGTTQFTCACGKRYQWRGDGTVLRSLYVVWCDCGKTHYRVIVS